MPEADHEAPGSEAELLAEIFREFREGLADRLETMRSALAELADGGEPAAVELFYRTAHSLKGAAPSFDADELVEPATNLADIGLAWYEGGAPSEDEIAAAYRALEQLGAAVRDYAKRAEGNASG